LACQAEREYLQKLLRDGKIEQLSPFFDVTTKLLSAGTPTQTPTSWPASWPSGSKSMKSRT
jgi:hypothetical protein